MRGPVEGFLLAVRATFDSFAFVVTVVFVLLTVNVKWPLTVIVILIWVIVPIALHRRRRLGLLELSEDGAQIDIGCLWRWLVIGSTVLVQLVDSCQGRIIVKTRGGRLLCYRLRLHLWRMLLETRELSEDCF